MYTVYETKMLYNIASISFQLYNIFNRSQSALQVTGLRLSVKRKNYMTSKTFRTWVPVNFFHDLWARSQKLFLVGFEMLAI